MTPDYADLAFASSVEKDDPDYETKRTLFAEMKELRDKYRKEEGLKGFALRRRVREEMNRRHAANGKFLEIIRILLTIFSIVLFFI